MNVYVDSSAFVKLVSRETETEPLIAWLEENRPTLFASELLRTEVIRAVRRSNPHALLAAKELLLGVNLLAMPSFSTPVSG